MTTFPVSDRIAVTDDERVLRAAVAAYLGRYRGESRVHTGCDLKVFLAWCSGEDLDPLALGRAEIERYVRWPQEVRRYQPSTVSRRLSVVVGFYRVCVIDAILEHSPADYVRRPTVPAESPTLGLGHLQFEALITTPRQSINPNDFALIALLGLLGLRIFEACGASITDLSEEHGHRVLRVHGKGGKVVLVPLPPQWPAPSTRPSVNALADRSCATPSVPGWTGTPRPAASKTSPKPPASGCRECTPTCCGTPLSPPCSTPASASATYRSPLVTPILRPPCATTELARTLTGTPTTSSPPTWHPAHNSERRAMSRPEISGQAYLGLIYAASRRSSNSYRTCRGVL